MVTARTDKQTSGGKNAYPPHLRTDAMAARGFGMSLAEGGFPYPFNNDNLQFSPFVYFVPSCVLVYSLSSCHSLYDAVYGWS